ncbi:hypothetical protein L2E82_15585 [Cichorium intybus]|uniref:Uncharacterized protein n=1 Tax=Cichorium intybus TaxID=13427 RepID=A0ACB9F2J3_CICIN|nr:hypothetical protein L2E82_15585 [Cichorium intybus]
MDIRFSLASLWCFWWSKNSRKIPGCRLKFARVVLGFDLGVLVFLKHADFGSGRWVGLPGLGRGSDVSRNGSGQWVGAAGGSGAEQELVVGLDLGLGELGCRLGWRRTWAERVDWLLGLVL